MTVIEAVLGTDVFVNEAGGITIIQGQEKVYFPARYAPAIVDAIHACVSEIEVEDDA